MIQIYHIVNRLQSFIPSCHHYFFQHCMNEQTKDQRYNLPVDLFCIKTHNSAYFTFPSKRCGMCNVSTLSTLSTLCTRCYSRISSEALLNILSEDWCCVWANSGVLHINNIAISRVSHHSPPQSSLPVSSTESVSFCALPRHQQTEAVYL